MCIYIYPRIDMFNDRENIHNVRSRKCGLVLVIEVVFSQQHL